RRRKVLCRGFRKTVEIGRQHLPVRVPLRFDLLSELSESTDRSQVSLNLTLRTGTTEDAKTQDQDDNDSDTSDGGSPSVPIHQRSLPKAPVFSEHRSSTRKFRPRSPKLRKLWRQIARSAHREENR